jgi:hypothetical protein
MTAAAVMLAGHLPFVWDSKRPDDRQGGRRGEGLPKHEGDHRGRAVATAASVRANVDGAERLVIDLQLASNDVIKAQVALNQMVAIGSRDAKRRCRTPTFARCACACAALALPCRRSTFREPSPRRRRRCPAAPPARRPGGGAKENFDLSTFYANDGALADSDNNLIPDRVDVLLTADGDGTDGIVDLARGSASSRPASCCRSRSRQEHRRADSEPVW